MKKLKKVFAVLLSVAMILGMSTTVFAAEVGDASAGDAPPANLDTIPWTPVTVKNVQSGSEVKAYQIVTYDTSGKYLTVQNDTPSDLKAPAAAQILAISNQITGGDTTVYADVKTLQPATVEGESVYQAKLEAGMWIVLVKSGGDEIYNPMIVSVNMTPDGKEGGIVDAAGNFTYGDVYAKHSKGGVTKEVTDPNYEVGQDIEFTVTADIPNYSSAYTEVVYSLTDRLSNELQYVTKEDDETKLEGATISIIDGNQTIPYSTTEPVVSGKTMTLDMDSATILAHKGGKVVLTYKAKLTDEAKANLNFNLNESHNKVTLEYSNNPSKKDDVTEKDDDTYHYTFGIDAEAVGGSNFFTQTGEFFKVDEKGNVEYIEGEKKFETKTGQTLAGAEFQLHKGTYNSTDLFADGKGNTTFTTTEDGRLNIVGLDSGKDYFLVETKAPQGYELTGMIVKVHITANNEGDTEGKRLENYTVTLTALDKDGNPISDKAPSEIKYNYGTTEDGELIIDSTVQNPFNYPNTKLGALPSTGGIGTIIFTVGGCLIMVVAAALYFANRRRSANSESK